MLERNAFNSIRRDKMFRAVLELAPRLFRFVHSAYSSPSTLFWGDQTIQSAEGVQQGDPLGPLLFCLTIHQLGPKLISEFQMFYLDDGTLGGTADDLRHDLEEVVRVGAEIGLELNEVKSEIICNSCNRDTIDPLLLSIPGALVVEPQEATLLGSPIGEVSSISSTLADKCNALKTMGDRLAHLSTHDAIVLLKHSFALPKLMHCLRTAPCFLSSRLQDYDELLKSIVSDITNIRFPDDSTSWSQATLPVRLGGLGIRRAVQLAPSAYLASTAASSDLVRRIVPPHLHDAPLSNQGEAEACWSKGHSLPPPEGEARLHQRSWDSIVVASVADSLLQTAPSPTARSRLLACSTRESGAWLEALPISPLGLRIEDQTVRIAIGLRLGTPLCSPHTCLHCGAEVDALSTHGLSCRRSQGRHYRHAALNDVIHRSLSAANVPSRLEPSGLEQADGKRPDGVTVVPWKSGKHLVWDATSPDTFAPSYLLSATNEAGAVAAAAESKKKSKYSCLGPAYFFTPVAIETSGACGPLTLEFLRDLGNRLRQATGEESSFAYLLQRLSVAVQRGNAASVLGTSSLSIELI